MSNTELASGLRELADWIEAHPEHELHVAANTYVFSREELADVARSLGRADKVDEGPFFTVRRKFGPIVVDYFTDRQEVCRRVVVDTIEVPAKVVPAHTEEVVEWVCDEPLLRAVS